ncbi:MAG: hypothetical protein HRT94_09320 [Alphaproteobacteria bacterium]|nr:hypothetical protein [Alphaproteobacteria bacterium]
MLGLELVGAGLLYVEAGSKREAAYEKAKQKAIAELTCDPTHSLDIKIDPTQTPIKYDFTKNIAQIGKIGEGAYSPYEPHEETYTMGLAVGRQSLEYTIGFSSMVYDKLDRACIHIREITVEIKFDPTIYVASEYPKGSCEFKEVLDHEKEHVHITQRTLNKHSKILGNNLKEALKGGYSFGPFKIDSVERAQQILQKKIAKITFDANDRMNKENNKLQNRFDDRDKGRITAKCDQKQ